MPETATRFEVEAMTTETHGLSQKIAEVRQAATEQLQALRTRDEV